MSVFALQLLIGAMPMLLLALAVAVRPQRSGRSLEMTRSAGARRSLQ